MKQFWAIAKKEFLQVIRNRNILLLIFILPITQFFIFGFALTNEIKNINIAVKDYSRSSDTHDVIIKLKNSSLTKIIAFVQNDEQFDRLFRKGEIDAGIVFREEDSIVKIQIITDATNPNASSTVATYLSKIIASSDDKILEQEATTKMLYNPMLKSTASYVPGVVAVIFMLVCILQTSVTIVKEKEAGTLQLLLTSNIPIIGIISGKAFPYLIFSIINAILILCLGHFVVMLTIQGNVIVLFLECLLFITCSLSAGLFISAMCDSQQAAILVSLVGMVIPTLMFSGFLFPIENMPITLQYFSMIVPSKWFYDVVLKIHVMGLGVTAIWKETLILLGYTLTFSLFTIRKLKNFQA